MIVASVDHFDDLVQIDLVVLSVLLVPLVANAHDGEELALERHKLSTDEPVHVSLVNVLGDGIDRVLALVKHGRVSGKQRVQTVYQSAVQTHLQISKTQTRLVSSNAF